MRKGETSPAVGWYGVLGEFPAWDVTLECRRALPARMDVVLYPMRPGQTSHPSVRRLHADGQVTALQVWGEGIDDTYILCEEGAGAVTIGDVSFEGRALLLRRKPVLGAYAVRAKSVSAGGTAIAAQ